MRRGADQSVVFDEHVRALFRASDRDAMRWAFDLWSYRDVAANAGAILQRLEAGSMPCDGAWASAKVDVFRRWVDAGAPESVTRRAGEPGCPPPGRTYSHPGADRWASGTTGETPQ